MTTPVVLVTGALTGIGRATALAFAREGARIVISGRRDDEGPKLAAELQKLGAEAEFLRSGVRHEDDVRSLIDKTVSRFGRLDAAVNCAGTEGTPGPVTEQTAETYAATFDTNVLGTLLSMKHEMRVMLAQGSGSIVNISSTYGHTGAAGASLYSASKHAVEGLTKSAALEAAPSGYPIAVRFRKRLNVSTSESSGMIHCVVSSYPRGEENMSTSTIRLHRVLRATPERVYRAFLEPDAMSKWLPPNGFTGKVHHMDAKVGGTHKMSFTNFTTGKSHSFGGEYVELVPHERIRYTDRFDDPNLPGEMQITVTLKKVSVGTELNIVQEGVPDVIPPEACYLGWQESLTLLAKLVEAEIRD